jgi:hypothetical protein
MRILIKSVQRTGLFLVNIKGKTTYRKRNIQYYFKKVVKYYF